MKASVAFCGAAAVLLIMPAVVFAQPFGRGFGRDGGGIARLLMSEEVRGEIELVEEQQAELQAMRGEIEQEMRGRMREFFSGMRDLGEQERRERMQEARAEMQLIRADVEERIGEVLLPHQMERLRQIELQQQVRRRGSSALLRGKMAEQLGITPEQQEEMRAKAAKAQSELQAKIDKLRKEAREEVLTVLTPDQRAKLDAMMGEQFDLPRQGRRGDFRGRRGPRGAGPGGPPELE